VNLAKLQAIYSIIFPMPSDLVSIVVPAYNEEDVIGRLLRSIKCQTYKNIEVIVIDDGSTDKTVKIARKYAEKVFTRKHAERSVQRNFGVKRSRGKYLLILDSDMKLTPNVVKECVEKILTDKKIGAIAIPEESVARTFWEKVKAFERRMYNLLGDEITDAARFFPKELFNKVGGYDEEITGPEDWDLPERILKLGFKQERIQSKIYHYERIPNPFMLAKKKYYYALKAHRYLKRHKISPVSTKTVYFLRPVFYRNWRILVRNPVMTLAMFFMLTLEQVGGGLGYLFGKYENQ
jgi:glycosyltransferase involved in cell wall biosynthesis